MMNERIKQFAEQAGLLGPGSRVGNAHEATEKFAELIVKDCVNFIDEFGSDLENGDVFGSSEKKLSEDLLAGHNGASLWRASELLRERFGVEE